MAGSDSILTDSNDYFSSSVLVLHTWPLKEWVLCSYLRYIKLTALNTPSALYAEAAQCQEANRCASAGK